MLGNPTFVLVEDLLQIVGCRQDSLRLAIIVGKISFLTLTRCLVFVRSNRWQKARAHKENSILKLGLPRRHGLRHGLLLHGLLLAGSAIAPASFWLALPSHASPCS